MSDPARDRGTGLTGAGVIVSGAAGGVGKAVVAKLVAAGARVCATDVDPAVADLARDGGAGSCITVKADVTLATDVERIFASAERAAAAIRSAHPMGLWAEPEEVADAILFLAGPTASFITGQMIAVDSGFTAR